MRYSYTNTTQVPVALEFTMHDITNLIQLLDPIAADEDHDQHYTAAAFVRGLKDAHARACETMSADLTYMTKLTA